jgi:hypothetical protein
MSLICSNCQYVRPKSTRKSDSACPICGTPYPANDIESHRPKRQAVEIGNQRPITRNLSISSIGHAVIRFTDFLMCAALAFSIVLAVIVMIISVRADGPFWSSVASGALLVFAVIGSCSIWAVLSGIYRNSRANTFILEQIAGIDSACRGSADRFVEPVETKISTQKALILGSLFLVAASFAAVFGIYGYDSLKAKQNLARQVELSDLRIKKAEQEVVLALEKFKQAQSEGNSRRTEDEGWIKP